MRLVCCLGMALQATCWVMHCYLYRTPWSASRAENVSVVRLFLCVAHHCAKRCQPFLIQPKPMYSSLVIRTSPSLTVQTKVLSKPGLTGAARPFQVSMDCMWTTVFGLDRCMDRCVDRRGWFGNQGCDH